MLLEHVLFASADWAIAARIVLASAVAVVTYRLVRRFFSRRRAGRIARAIDFLWLPAFIGAAPVMGYAFGLSQAEVLTFSAVQALLAALILAGAVGGLVGATLKGLEDLARGLAQSMPALLRSLPFLTLFSLVNFLTSETWQVLGRMPVAHLAVVVTLFAALGALFLLSRLPDQVRDIEHVGNAEGPPLTPSQRRNVAVVVGVQAALQIACVVALMTLLFTVLGTFAISEAIYRQWEVDPGQAWRPSLFGHPTVVSMSLIKVAVVLAVICGLSYSVSILTDPIYRADLLDRVGNDMAETFRLRRRYLWLRESVDR